MVQVLSRSEWGATAPLGTRMTLPALGVFVHHSVTVFDDDGSHESTVDVAADMREIEAIGVSRFGRFPYSFCGHPTCWLAEGAGLSIGAHTADRNSRHLGYCLIGNKENEPVSDCEVEQFGRWCQAMVTLGHLSPSYFIEPHRSVKATACPGAHTIARWSDLLDAAHGSYAPASPGYQEDDDMPMIVAITDPAHPDAGAQWFVNGITRRAFVNDSYRSAVQAELNLPTTYLSAAGWDWLKFQTIEANELRRFEAMVADHADGGFATGSGGVPVGGTLRGTVEVALA